jgi:NAD(P)-dependent dehydrogenase (short-subunit alcohol dehydrogenase family)
MASIAHDPRELGPKPPFPQQKQSPPGSVKELNPPADHGERSYVGCGKLKDRIAIVTGADSGIGRAVSIAFAKEGAKVVMSYLPEEETDASETADVIESSGSKALKRPGDISDQKYAHELVRTAMDQFGQLDIVVNNAGYQMAHESIDEITWEELERTFRINVF